MLEDGEVGDLVIDIAHPSAHSPPGNNMGYDMEEMDLANSTAVFYPKAWQLDVEFTVTYSSIISKQMDTNEDGVIDEDEIMNARFMFQQTFNDGEQENQTYRFDGQDYSNYVYWWVDTDWSHLGGVDDGGQVTLRSSTWYQVSSSDQVTFEIDNFVFPGNLCIEDTDSFMYESLLWGNISTGDYCVTGFDTEEATLIITLINLVEPIEPMPEIDMVVDMVADLP